MNRADFTALNNFKYSLAYKHIPLYYLVSLQITE